MKPRRFLLGLIVGMLALGACGGSGSETADDDGTGAVTTVATDGVAASDDSGDDADQSGDDGASVEEVGVCDWFTEDDAEAAAGGLELVASEDNDALACEYIDEAEYEATTARVGLRVSFLPDALDGTPLEDWIVQLKPEAQTEPVASIDGALSVDDVTHPAVFLVHDGGVVQVTASRGGLDGAVQLAEVVSGNF
jgi:hypothetical protein